MGGEQAASTLSTVRQQARGEESEGETPAAAAFKAPIREQFEREGNPYYASARLWDDGILDPLESRAALGLALAATAGSADSGDANRRLPHVDQRCSRPCSSPTAARSPSVSSVPAAISAFAASRCSRRPTATAPHVALADVAVPIGPAAARGELSRRRTGLSTQPAEHARRGDPSRLRLPRGERRRLPGLAADAGICFVGPSAGAMEAMGDKLGARRTMARPRDPDRPRAAIPMPIPRRCSTQGTRSAFPSS